MENNSKNGKRIDKKVIIVMVIIGLICNAVLMIAGNLSKKSVEEQIEAYDRLSLDTRASKESVEENSLAYALADRQVYFSGIEDCDITENTTIYLENDKENEDIFMRYQISDKETGEVYEVTDLIPAGEHVEWVPGECLAKGEHTLLFNQAPFFSWEEAESGYVPLTQANNEVVVTVK